MLANNRFCLHSIVCHNISSLLLKRNYGRYALGFKFFFRSFFRYGILVLVFSLFCPSDEFFLWEQSSRSISYYSRKHKIPFLFFGVMTAVVVSSAFFVQSDAAAFVTPFFELNKGENSWMTVLSSTPIKWQSYVQVSGSISLVSSSKYIKRLQNKTERWKEKNKKKANQLKNTKKRNKLLVKKLEISNNELLVFQKKTQSLQAEIQYEKDNVTRIEESLQKSDIEKQKVIEEFKQEHEKVAKEQKARQLAAQELDAQKCRQNFTRKMLVSEISKSRSRKPYCHRFAARIVVASLLAFCSFRANTRLLRGLRQVGIIDAKFLPCSNTIINWAMRAGLGKLKQVDRSNVSCIHIMDHCIGIGKWKLLVILRVTKSAWEEAIEKNHAIALEDAELIHLDLVPVSNGQVMFETFVEFYSRIELPELIISDCGSDIIAGIDRYNRISEKNKQLLHCQDYGHAMANALQAQYEKQDWFKKVSKVITHGANKIRQTQLAHYLPPKLRTKARFQNIGKRITWAAMIIDTINGNGASLNDQDSEKLTDAFGELATYRDQIEEFVKVQLILDDCAKLLKTKGLNAKTALQSRQLLRQVSKTSKVRTKMDKWLKQTHQVHFRLQPKGWKSIPISSDIVESFFSKYKSILERMPLAEPTRIVLILPLLCGKNSIIDIETSLDKTTGKDVCQWISDNVPETSLRKKRKLHESLKQGNAKTIQQERAENGSTFSSSNCPEAVQKTA